MPPSSRGLLFGNNRLPLDLPITFCIVNRKGTFCNELDRPCKIFARKRLCQTNHFIDTPISVEFQLSRNEFKSNDANHERSNRLSKA